MNVIANSLPSVVPLQDKVKQVLHRLASAIVLSICFTLLYGYIIGATGIDNWRNYVSDIAFGALYFALLHEGYLFVEHWFSIRFSNQQLSVKRFVMAVFTFVCSSVLLLWGMRSIKLLLLTQQVNSETESQLRLLYVTIGIVAFLYFMLLTFLQLIRDIQQASVKAEKLQRERAQAQINTLKNQISPHFLFNTFNTLSSLIYIEEDKTTIQFIQELKRVFRYIMGNKHKELVELKTELSFVNAYFYLLKIRFQDSILLEMFLPEHAHTSFLPPLTLQMLLENAVKHNTFSKAAPLHIRITAEGTLLSITNNLQVREAAAGDSMGIGLQNIINRYQYLTDQQVEIYQSEQNYTVKIPLLRHA
ncbi:sensor histidine kinase [Pontibacter populi]|uniref:Histidine kinase n=1 Tax=Pontibacter populi TaxID=890055 RepID=A0ABV1RZA4_9BACT